MSEEKREPTAEEIKAYRESMKKYYDDELPLLKKRKEYETLLADIAEQKARAATMYQRLAMIMNPEKFANPDQEDFSNDEIERPDAPIQEVNIPSKTEDKKKSRKLKTD